jgi:hypothetical protein
VGWQHDGAGTRSRVKATSPRTSLFAGLARGAAAGAAATTALNAVTYLDMAVRARPASSTPEASVERLAEEAGVAVPGEGEARDNRLAGLGPLTGIAAGVGAGALLGCARSLGWRPRGAVTTVAATITAMVAGNAPMAALGVSDPRTWSASSWLADVVPHLAYGATAGWVLAALDR